MAMTFLELHEIPHRNLATRNVLVVRETETALRIKVKHTVLRAITRMYPQCVPVLRTRKFANSWFHMIQT